jgi:hypothetical protein
MEQSPWSESNSFSATQNILRHLRNPNVHKSPSLVSPTPSSPILLNASQCYPPVFVHVRVSDISHSFYIHCLCHFHCCDDRNNIWRGAQIAKLVRMQPLPSFGFASFLCAGILLYCPLSNTICVLSLGKRGQVPHP